MRDSNQVHQDYKLYKDRYTFWL